MSTDGQHNFGGNNYYNTARHYCGARLSEAMPGYQTQQLLACLCRSNSDYPWPLQPKALPDMILHR